MTNWCRWFISCSVQPYHHIISSAVHIDVPANLSPDSHLSSALWQEEATRESPSPHAAGPSCARMWGDQNGPSFTAREKIPQISDHVKIGLSNEKKQLWGQFQKSQEESISRKPQCRQECRAEWSITVCPPVWPTASLILQVLWTAGQRSHKWQS